LVLTIIFCLFKSVENGLHLSS